jgi:hypothetical protein
MRLCCAAACPTVLHAWGCKDFIALTESEQVAGIRCIGQVVQRGTYTHFKNASVSMFSA